VCLAEVERAAGDSGDERVRAAPRRSPEVLRVELVQTAAGQPETFGRLVRGDHPVPELGENVAHHLGGDPVCELGSIHAPQGKRNPGTPSLPFPAPAVHLCQLQRVYF
jgi:hypothetical protein